MADLFARLLLGHLTGDYLLQSRHMALTKATPGIRGVGWCLIHSVIYTLSVCLFLWRINPVLCGLIFISHYPLDRWSWADQWLKLIRGRNLLMAHQSTSPYREFEIAFACLVYTVVDNTWHLIFLWLIAYIL